MKLKFTSGANNPWQFITQISCPTNINPSLWTLDDSYINIKGLETTDTVEVKRISDNTTLYTFTGAGVKNFTLGANYDVSVYFVRKDSPGNVLMSTIKSPVKLTIGNNGTANLFYGAEVQLAESGTISIIADDITEIQNNLPKVNRNVIKASKLIPANETF